MTDLERYQAQAPIRVSPEEAAKYARAFAASKMFSAGYDDANADQIFAQIMVGAEYGFGPGASMVNLYLMPGGKIELSANAQASFIKSSGKYDFRVTEHTDTACEITVIAVPTGEVVGVERYTWEDAERQELTGLTKRGHKTSWHKTPRNMLFARCVSNVCAFHCPDVVPMRTYSPGEVSGHAGEERETLTPATMASIAAIEQRVQDGRDPVGVEPVEEVTLAPEDITEPEPQVGAMADMQFEHDLFVAENPKGTAQGADRFSPEVIETRLRNDLPKLSDEDKVLVKTLVAESGRPWGYHSIVEMVIDLGYTDIFSVLHGATAEIAGNATETPQDASAPIPGVTGRATGSQTSPTLSDAQVRLLNAKCGEAGLSEPERKAFIRKFAQVDSSRQIRKADFDDLLAALLDIAEGGLETKRAYLGGVA